MLFGNMFAKVYCLLFMIGQIAALRYLSGDFLTDSTTKSPHGSAYPRETVDSIVRERFTNFRRPRSIFDTEDPLVVRQKLLDVYTKTHGHSRHTRQADAWHDSNFVLSSDLNANIKVSTRRKTNITTTVDPPCPKVPGRLCKSHYNTTAPMYGISLTSGKQVTIVQKFPDLLQQVIFEVCTQRECDILHGECVQTYVPYLFLVIPLGPVTLTGQDYVLVESGCNCRPKYAGENDIPSPFGVPDLAPPQPGDS